MILEHLPILQVAIPLVLAPLCLLLRNSRLTWVIALVGSLWAFVCAVLLLTRVLNNGPLEYALGGWEAPWGIALRIDLTGCFILLLTGLIASLVIFWAKQSVENEIRRDQINLFYCMYLLCLTGILGIIATGDAFNVFVFLEISSLSSYTMIAMGRDRRALTSSFHYLVMGTIGATFILIAIGMLYMMTGTLNMADLAERLPPLRDTTTVRTAFAFLTVGLSLKIALLPLHQWLPDAYTFAPSAVSAFLAGTSTKVALYVLLRFFFTVFGVDFVFTDLRLDVILLPLSILAIFVASIIAVFQEDVKRMLAYSSLAQIGYMTLGIALVNTSGLTATLVHMFNHALIKGGLFMAIGGLFLRIGSTRFADLKGAGRAMPWTMSAIIVGGCGLIGVPLTAGFVSKWYLVIAAIENGAWVVVVAIVLASLIAVVYVWRIVETLYFNDIEQDTSLTEAPLAMLIPTWLMVILVVWAGIDTGMTVGIAERAALALIGNSP